MTKNIVNKIEKAREAILFILVSIWIIIPILKSFKLTCSMAMNWEYNFIFVIGGIGLFFLILDIYKNLKQKENRKEYIKEILPIIIFAIFMIWTLISSIFSPDREKAFLGTWYRKDGYITYLAYAGFFACGLFMNSKENKRMFINILVIVALLNIIMAELYNRGIMNNILVPRSIKTTVFYQFNHYGYYLLIATVSSIFLFVTQKNIVRKILHIFSCIILMYYLIINNTFGCHLALVITLIIFMIYSIIKKKNIGIAALSIIMFLGISFGNQETRSITQKNINTFSKDINNIITAIVQTNEKSNIENEINNVKNNKKDKIVEDEFIKDEIMDSMDRAGTGRMRLWKNGIKFFLERPILGYGPENLGAKYIEVNIRYGQDRPHNLLIQLATTSGIIGLVSYISAIGIILIRGLKRSKIENSIHIISFFVVIAYLISSMFGNSMYYTSPYFFIFLGFLMCENINEKSNIEE